MLLRCTVPSSLSSSSALLSLAAFVFVAPAAFLSFVSFSGVEAMAPSSSSSKRTTTPKNIVVVGGGIQGTSVAYHLAKRIADADGDNKNAKIVLLESQEPASAASGKGGGFMAKHWGDGSPTQSLHHVAFDLYSRLADELGCTSYRTLPVLSVAPGRNRPAGPSSIMPNWLDGRTGRISVLGQGDDTAQITPHEFVHAMLNHQSERIQVVKGTCVGVESEKVANGDDDEERRVTYVQYQTNESEDQEPKRLPADCVVISAGPWSCAAEDWFRSSGSDTSANLQLPMEGIKSTSIVWKQPPRTDDDGVVDATALFCGEDNRFGTHLEVYPRPDNTIYICGIGGSDYISKDDLKQGAFRETCLAKQDRVNAAVASFQEMSDTYKQKGELKQTQACMRPCPPDALPYMGAIPGYKGAYINAGHNCWGIAWAPACGLAMSELILDGESSTIDLSPFDPCRFTPSLKGSRGRKRRGTSVGEQW